ncbi:cytochrome oxidase subunit III, partial [Flavobacteriaceae bacterium]|nr:cytochrome oxidase subunit III [Flavobacteriaceae bacterium]
MDTTVAKPSTDNKTWSGGNRPLNASYGKMMMWFFIVSDALTFSGFLAAYGFSRFKFIDSWPIADEVFTHVPFIHGNFPMYYVAFMTFILILSSVTMVLAVDAGHHMKKNKVIVYLFLTIIGGLIFVGSQAWEWGTFIKGTYGAVETNGGKVLQFVKEDGSRIALGDFATPIYSERTSQGSNEAIWFYSETPETSVSLTEVTKGFLANESLLIRTQYLDKDGKRIVLSRAESVAKLKSDGKSVVEGANLRHNEYGTPLFADFFFFITGFHGFHVFSGVVFN